MFQETMSFPFEKQSCTWFLEIRNIPN